MVRLLRVILSVGKVEFWVCMGGMVVVGGVLAGGLGLGKAGYPCFIRLTKKSLH